jgi:hypothetical protein
MVTMIQFQIGFHSKSKMQSMFVELQATLSSLFHTTETFVHTIIEELRVLPILTNDENLEPMHDEDNISCYLSLSSYNTFLQMVVDELCV